MKQMIENLHALYVQVGWKILRALRKKYMHKISPLIIAGDN